MNRWLIVKKSFWARACTSAPRYKRFGLHDLGHRAGNCSGILSALSALTEQLSDARADTLPAIARAAERVQSDASRVIDLLVIFLPNWILFSLVKRSPHCVLGSVLYPLPL